MAASWAAVKYRAFGHLSLWPSGIGTHSGRNRLLVQVLAAPDTYSMFIEPTITRVPSGFSGYIWLESLHTKICQQVWETKNVIFNKTDIEGTKSDLGSRKLGMLYIFNASIMSAVKQAAGSVLKIERCYFLVNILYAW